MVKINHLTTEIYDELYLVYVNNIISDRTPQLVDIVIAADISKQLLWSNRHESQTNMDDFQLRGGGRKKCHNANHHVTIKDTSHGYLK